jgi:hypothetical protein
MGISVGLSISMSMSTADQPSAKQEPQELSRHLRIGISTSCRQSSAPPSGMIIYDRTAMARVTGQAPAQLAQRAMITEQPARWYGGAAQARVRVLTRLRVCSDWRQRSVACVSRVHGVTGACESAGAACMHAWALVHAAAAGASTCVMRCLHGHMAMRPLLIAS